MDIVHSDAMDWDFDPPADSPFGARRKKLGAHAGNQRLGASLYELEPGRRAFPYHFHHANEEALFVLSGEATLRTPDGEELVQSGDYVAFPAGATGAHQVINRGSEPVRFLCLSTMQCPDITQYPDTGKVGLFSGSPPGGAKEDRTLSTFLSLDATMGYLEGEPDGRE